MWPSFKTLEQNKRQTAAVCDGNIFWLFWTCVSIVPWILPTHTPPWPHFYSELLWVALLVSLVFWASLASKQPWHVHWAEVVVLLAAGIPLVQGAAGIFTFPAESLLVSSYLVAFAFAIGVGRQLFAVCKYQAIDYLLTGLAIAAVMSTGLALYQWLALEGLDLMVPAMAVGGTRATANMGQSNNLSTLMVWGLVALWWAYERQKIACIGALTGAAFLLLGVALTGSRTGWIQITLLGLALVVVGPRQSRGLRGACAVSLLFFFGALVVALPYLSSAMWESIPRTTAELATVGLRSKFWAMSIEAIWQKPWFGYGWNQTVLAQVALANAYPHLGEAMGHSHNIVLDMLVWNGVPLGALLVALGLWWLARCVRRSHTEAHCILLAFVTVFLVHAMLELPHIYAYFLLPTGLVLGYLSAISPEPPVFALPRLATGVASVVAAGALVLMFIDYAQTESYLTARAMVAARIVGAEMPASPTIYLLKPLQSAIERIHTEPRRGMAAQELDDLRKASLRYPTSGAPFRYAKAASLNGRLDDANTTLATICALFSKRECEAAGQDVGAAQR